MEKPDVTWRIFGMYMLIIFFMCVCGQAFGQISIAQYNASWNSSNEVKMLATREEVQEEIDNQLMSDF